MAAQTLLSALGSARDNSDSSPLDSVSLTMKWEQHTNSPAYFHLPAHSLSWFMLVVNSSEGRPYGYK